MTRHIANMLLPGAIVGTFLPRFGWFLTGVILVLEVFLGPNA